MMAQILRYESVPLEREFERGISIALAFAGIGWDRVFGRIPG